MAQHSHPPRRVAQSPKQNTFFGGAAILAVGIMVALRNSAITSRPEKPFSAPQGSSQ